MQVARWCFLFCAALPLATLPTRCGTCCGADASPVVLRFVIEDAEPIYLAVEIASKNYQFIADTGSTITVFDDRFRDQLEELDGGITVTTPSKQRFLSYYASPEIKIGDGAVVPLAAGSRVGMVDLTTVRSAAGQEVHGILGMDFLKFHVMRLNFDQGFGELRSDASLHSLHEERLFFQKGTPGVLLRIPGIGFQRFLVDTGAIGDSLQLKRDRFDALIRAGHLRILGERSGAEFDGVKTARKGVINFVEFGPHRFFNLSVTESSTDAINVPFLQRFEVELDFPKRVGRFLPGRRIDVPDAFNCSGFGVRRIDGDVIVAAHQLTYTTMPEEIQDGDRLHRINGVKAPKLPLARIRQILTVPDSKVEITLEREGITKDLVIRLSQGPELFPAKLSHELIDEPVDDCDK